MSLGENASLKRLAQGSTKDIYRLQSGNLLFDFTDRISVFDWGPLKDTIESKGLHLEHMARHFEKVFCDAEIPSTFIPTESQTQQGFVVSPVWNSKIFSRDNSLEVQDEFIPLECIFRWGVPPGSSLLKRYPEFKSGEKFSEPLVEFSTKLEPTDRYLSRLEVEKILQPFDLELKNLSDFVAKVALVLSRHLSKIGLMLWDGKIEVSYSKAQKLFKLVDALTLDEIRVAIPGLERISLSKELLRQWLGRTPWAHQIFELKKKNPLGLPENWKSQITWPVPRLGEWRCETLSSLYRAFSECLDQQKSSPLMSWIRGLDRPKPKVFLLTHKGGREQALERRLSFEGAEVVKNPDSADSLMVTLDQELSEGLVDDFLRNEKWVWAPLKSAAKIEWSKDFGREIAKKAGLIIPDYYTDPKVFLKRFEESEKSKSEAPVIKKDGLAAGKGVYVPKDWADAKQFFDTIKNSGTILFEEKVSGFECSAFFAMNPQEICFLGTAQDFKRRFEGDEGPNTGGMGAYAPHPKITEQDEAEFYRMAQKTAAVLKDLGTPFCGILYLGLMKDPKKGWVLIEYNARPGDPETQALIECWTRESRVLLKFLGLDIESPPLKMETKNKIAVALSLVRKVYPEVPLEIEKLSDWTSDKSNARVYLNPTSKGRVGYVVGVGDSKEEASENAFELLLECPFKNKVDWRKDIL